jgi:beta-lactamase regulating signal transducer with metallopeptidase domain/peptidoglycan/xylan/chitin deacetylase (PgdA/CDA1 family)
MNWNILAESRLVEHLGWTLAHSIWQMALIAAVLFIVLRLLVNISPNTRYLLSVAALVLTTSFPVLTYLEVSERIDIFGAKTAGDGAVERVRDHSTTADAGTAQATLDRQIAASLNAGTSEAHSSSTAADTFADAIQATFPIAVGLWFIGIAVFSLRLSGGFWRLRQLKTIDVSPADREWQNRFSMLCASLKIDRPVALLRSGLVDTPIAAGLIRPLIIVPASVFLQMDPRQLESIIAHELIHIRRHDALVNIFQNISEVLFFYHPAVWWISAQIRREREFAADAAVLEISDDSLTYATALANLEEIRHSTKINAASLATAANGGNLMKRIQRILNKKTEDSRAISAWSAGLAIAVSSALLLAVFSLSPKSVVNGQKRDSGGRKIAVGFVSIPPVDRSQNPPQDGIATARLLIAGLKAHNVPAIGFVNGSQISDGDKIYPVRAEIVKMWREEGFDVGIGGFNHIWFFETPYDDFVTNVEKNDAVVKKLFAEKTQPRYFSYPFLNTGKSAEERDRFERWLQDRGLASVKYTIDNNEWMYSYAYDMARFDNDVNTMREIRTAFIDYMSKMFEHYERYSREMFGRDIPQTMVLTPSRLVADTTDDLFGMIAKRGYTFVPMNEAQSDAAYQTPENFAGRSGISWFERWRMKQGQPLLAEPAVDAQVQKIWDAKKVLSGAVKKS